MGSWSNRDPSITIMDLSAGRGEPLAFTDRMRDDAADCRRAERSFSLVNTCNLTDTDKDTRGAVLGGQRTGTVRVNRPENREC